jgi:beta-N-acetylhexosaminidase
MAHGWSDDETPSRRQSEQVEQVEQVEQSRQRWLNTGDTAFKQSQTFKATQQQTRWNDMRSRPTSHGMSHRGRTPLQRASVLQRWGRRAYPAVLLAVVACLLAVLACDLSPTLLSALSHGTHGNETGTQSGPEIPTPAHYPPEKPLTFADLVNQTVNYTMSQMTLDEKIGQMMMFETYAQSWNSTMVSMVSQMHAGAIIIYKKNMVSPSQLTTFISTSQAHTTIPMFVTMDEEGGNVDRLGDMGFSAPLPSATYLGSTGNPQLAAQAGARAAADLAKYGINTDLAPVVDVRLIPNQIEGPRLYGNDPATVTAFAGAFLQGLQQNHIIACLKHWPGIGDAAQDPHLTLPVINRTLPQLESTEFAPFRNLLKDNPGMIMVTHVILSAIDPNMPSSLSPKVVQDVLRDELGYQGVIITDNLWMQGVSSRYSLGQAAVLAIQAGDDLLEGAWDPSHLQLMINAVKSAVTSGQISVSRIDQSVRRLLTLKATYGILPLHSGAHQPRPLPSGFAYATGSALGDVDVPHRAANAA